ncbi:hypothetical protein N9228_00760 [bacterium]|nr:hypothetical protein [Akkermansiaceae bacterium]MDA7611120.1 hypothetical protein [bacterium]MDA7526735.1 hypothetical protein [Akkermansiaceae bacterium]MDA7630644.1 hypothetical protein [Akkermansiaceae bacterium]MDA7645840.1 hypothetical protein [bacterium]
MSKLGKIHCGVLSVLIIYTFIAWAGVKRDENSLREAEKKALENGQSDPWSEVNFGENRQDAVEGMVKVGIPLLVTVIYGGVLTILYVLPVLVDKVSEEMMGSTAEVDDDPLDEARAAVAEGEYADAIAVYRRYLLENPESRHSLVEIAKIQRDHLNSPAGAISTLEQGLDEYEWSEDDAAFLMFRIAEISEEDLADKNQVIAVMKRVIRELQGTRHAGNAAHKLRELEEG